jgi:hypothetical protein
LAHLAIFRPPRPQELERDVPMQLVIVGEIDEAEAAFSQNFLDAIATNAFGHLFGSGFHCRFFLTARLVSAGSLGFIHAFIANSLGFPCDRWTAWRHRPPQFLIDNHFTRAIAESHGESRQFRLEEWP